MGRIVSIEQLGEIEHVAASERYDQAADPLGARYEPPTLMTQSMWLRHRRWTRQVESLASVQPEAGLDRRDGVLARARHLVDPPKLRLDGSVLNLLDTGRSGSSMAAERAGPSTGAGRSRQGQCVGLRALDDDSTVTPVPTAPDRIARRRRLGGLLNEYQPTA